MGFPSPLQLARSCITCSIPDVNIERDHPEWLTPNYIFNRPGFPNLNFSYVKPILGWFGKVAELIPPPTDPEKFASYFQKLATITIDMTLPKMQFDTLNSLQFPDFFKRPPYNYTLSLQWLNRIPRPQYDIEFEGKRFTPPNLKKLVFGHFTAKFNLFLEIVLGPLKKPEMPTIPSNYNDLIDLCLSKINANPHFELPKIPTWRLMNYEERIKIPAPWISPRRRPGLTGSWCSTMLRNIMPLQLISIMIMHM